MKIKSKVFVEFLKKVNMDGNEKVNEAIFDFSESGLKISAMSPTKVNRIDAMLLPSAFVEYNAIEKIGIQDVSTLIKLLGKFGDEIELTVDGNIIKVSDSNKEVSTELMDVQFIQTIGPVKEFQFDDMLSIDSSKINETINDASINSEFNLNFKTVEKGLQISSTGKYKFNRTFATEEAKGGVDVSFGQPFINAVKSLTGKLELNLKSNFPVKILEKTEHSVVNLIVSPIIK
jgi:hypothetical protein